MRVKFNPSYLMSEYHSLELVCKDIGEYEVSEAKAKQLLRDFPENFKATEDQVETGDQAAEELVEQQIPSEPNSKATARKRRSTPE